MSKAKKVIFVIVEGPTDEDALSSVLKQIFSSAEVHFHVIHGDITTEDRKVSSRTKAGTAASSEVFREWHCRTCQRIRHRAELQHD